MNVVEEDLSRLKVQEWRKLVEDRDKRREIVMAAKTLRERETPEEEEKRRIIIITYYVLYIYSSRYKYTRFIQFDSLVDSTPYNNDCTLCSLFIRIEFLVA